MYSLGQHAYDADCRLFLAVFAGECGEGVRREQARLQEEVGGCPPSTAPGPPSAMLGKGGKYALL